MPTPDLDHLRKVAEVRDMIILPDGPVGDGHPVTHDMFLAAMENNRQRKLELLNFDYTFDPPTVLSLLDALTSSNARVEKAEAERDDAIIHSSHWARKAGEAMVREAALREELAKADAALVAAYQAIPERDALRERLERAESVIAKARRISVSHDHEITRLVDLQDLLASYFQDSAYKPVGGE